jgi:NADH:ubiquinone reductase (H+-translocating)
MTSIDTASRRPRVVIIGAGFGGLSAAKQLARAPFDISIVDRHNYHGVIPSGAKLHHQP